MEEFERLTELSSEAEEAGGDPERVVDAQDESRYEDGEEILGDGQAQAVDAQEDADAASEETVTEPDPTPKQTREENAAIRAARLKASKDAREAALREADAEIAAAGIENPYTKKPFSSMKEFKEYAAQVKRARLEEEADRTGRTVEELEEDAENRAFLSRLRKQIQWQEMGEFAQGEESFVSRDLRDFVEKHPEMNSPEKLEALENNKAFRRFCGSRFGKEPLAELYEAFQDLVGTSGAAAVAKAASKNDRSTGGGSSGGVTLTPSQKRELDEWNRANPDMPMTEREFAKL
ncbi:MAG: hypothetical protein IKC50_00315 [Oscillospiraceae bacterium]|nr:hypothetical protein [Oscillospiraceae bacterium]MBR2976710.1 hypothetical protein [Oscillospiraceae bacterium]